MSSQIETTAAGIVAATASRSTVATAGVGVLGWVTGDGFAALVGASAAVLGLLVNGIFRWIDSRDKHRQVQRDLARIDAEDARAREKHALEMRLLQSRIGPPEKQP
jgi:hypothetical protein